MTSLNYKNLLKITLAYSVVLLLASIVISGIIIVKIVFPPKLSIDNTNPQLHNVNQAIDLISGQTIQD